MDLRELNYILIPKSSESVDNFLESRAGRLLKPLVGLAQSSTVEGQVLLVVTLVTGAAGVDVTFSNLYLVFCGLAGLIVAALVCRPFARLDGLDVRIEHPPRVAAGQPLSFTAVLRNDADVPRYALRVRGPFLPWDGTWRVRRPSVAVLEPGRTARVELVAQLDVRGERYVGRFWGCSVRPLGLAAGERVYSERVRVTVVPRVFPLSGLAAPPAIDEPPEERGRSLHTGESFELLGVRPYRAGDRIRDLHARSWARLGQPMVREYRRATRRRVLVLLHTEARSPQREVFDAAVDLTASLVAWVLEQEAAADLLVAGERSLEMRVGEEGLALEAALDALAPVSASVAPVDASALLGGRLDHVGAALFVFAGWDAERASILARARAATRHVRAFVATHRKSEAAAARALGVRHIGPSDLSSEVVDLS